MSDEEEDGLFATEADVQREAEKEQLQQQEQEQEKEQSPQDELMGNTEESKVKEEKEEEVKPRQRIVEAFTIPGDESDPVVQSFPVFFTSSLNDKVYLYQYPTRSASYPLVEANNSGILESRYKPKSGIVEVDVPIDTNRFYDHEKGERWSKVDRQTMGGVFKDPAKNEDGSEGSKYMVGVFKNEELHFTRIKSVAQLRPQFRYVDKEQNTEKEIVRNVEQQQKPATKKEAKAVQMSAKASGDNAPKYSGALQTRKLADEEAFVDYDWYDRDCDECWKEGDKLVANKRDKLISKTTIDDYITELQK